MLKVSLFGELFHEMLQRDFGQRILQALLNAPKANRSPSPEPTEKSSRKRHRDDAHSPSASAKKAKPTEAKVRLSSLSVAAVAHTQVQPGAEGQFQTPSDSPQANVPSAAATENSAAETLPPSA